MDAYEVHKKVQEAIMAVEIYQLRSLGSASMWFVEIRKGLDDLAKRRQILFPSNDILQSRIEGEHVNSDCKTV